MAEWDRTVPFYKVVNGFTLPGGFSTEDFLEALNYVPRKDDLFVATYPKCGTTWTQQIIFLIYSGGKPATSVREFEIRTPFLEMYGRESGEEMPRLGAIKTHLPFHLAPYSESAKYLYVCRNPKDVAVSYYHHFITDPVFTFQEGNFERYFEDFISGNIAFNDYFDHFLGWYEHRNDPNVMFLTYEELKRDTKGSILKIAKFMGDSWFDMISSDEEIMNNVLKYSSANFMREFYTSGQAERQSSKENKYKYPGLKYMREFCEKHRKPTDEAFNFVRKGESGGWRGVLSAEQAERLDRKTEEKLGETDIYAYWKRIGCI